MKSKVDKLDIDKLVPVVVDLNKLSYTIKSYFVKKTEYNTKIKTTEDKIPDITSLARALFLTLFSMDSFGAAHG